MKFETVAAVEVEPREQTKAVRLLVSDISDRLFIRDAAGKEIWVSTSYGGIQVGVVGGQIYYLSEGQLVSAGQSNSPLEYQPARKVAEVTDGDGE